MSEAGKRRARDLLYMRLARWQLTSDEELLNRTSAWNSERVLELQLRLKDGDE